MTPIAAPPRDEPWSGWGLDLRQSEVLLAWRTVAMRLRACCQPDGLASLLLRSGNDAGPAESTGVEDLRRQMKAHLAMLVSSTRDIDVCGAMAAALPLAAGRDPTSARRDFLAGYACGLETSPALDIRRLRFLHEFNDAVMATKACGGATRGSGTEHAMPEGHASPWARVVLEAISYGGATMAALLAQRAMSADQASGADTMLGALLGSTLWRDCPLESDLTGQLCRCGIGAHRPGPER